MKLRAVSVFRAMIDCSPFRHLVQVRRGVGEPPRFQQLPPPAPLLNVGAETRQGRV